MLGISHSLATNVVAIALQKERNVLNMNSSTCFIVILAVAFFIIQCSYELHAAWLSVNLHNYYEFTM